jgi:hypothetical protein
MAEPMSHTCRSQVPGKGYDALCGRELRAPAGDAEDALGKDRVGVRVLFEQLFEEVDVLLAEAA